MADSEQDLSLRDAIWFAQQLGNYSPEDQVTLINTRDDREFEKIAGTNSGPLLKARLHWIDQTYQGVKIPIAPGRNQETQGSGKGQSATGTLVTGAGLGVAFGLRNAEYNDFKKSAKKYAEEKAAAWEKKPDLARTKTKEEAYALAYREAHDRLALRGTEAAQKWANKYKDQDIASALERKRILDEQLTKEWNDIYTPAQLQDPKIKSTISAAVRQRVHPNTITSKGTTQQTGKTVFSNTMLDNNDPKQIERINKLVWKKKLSAKEQNELIGYHPERVIKAETLLGKTLNEQQRLAILKAHYTGLGASGKTGGLAGAYNYTQQHIEQKAQILKQAGFDREQRRRIIEAGIAGSASTQSANQNQSAMTPFPTNTLTGTLPQNTLSGTGQPNTLNGQGNPNTLKDDQAPALPPNKRGLRSRLKRRIMESHLGKRLASSRIGKLAGKANRLGNMASKATRRIKNMLSPISYLQKLLLRSALGSLVGAIGGLISAAFSFIAGLTVSLIGTTAALLAGITSAVAGISLGATLAVFTVVGIIILLIITLFALLFQPPSKGELPSQSPYPGIFYSIVGEEKVPNGQNIKYDIIFGYDSTQTTAATPPLENITLAADIPLGTALVARKTTGNYASDSRKIRWKLSENEPETDVVTQKSYHFVLTLNPDDDITVTVTISLEGAGTGGGGPGDSGDLFAGADSSPTNNTCSKYGGVMGDIQGDFPQMSIATNFGDPECSYTDAKFKKVLELTETNTKNIEFWQDITDCESGSANGYSPAADGGGTWGRFQMRRGFPNPGKPWKAEDNDRGDIPWQRQIQNATSYNNSLAASGNNFGYWGTAMCLCYYSKYNNQPYCGDIKNNNKVRSPSSGLCSSCTANKGKR